MKKTESSAMDLPAIRSFDVGMGEATTGGRLSGSEGLSDQDLAFEFFAAAPDLRVVPVDDAIGAFVLRLVGVFGFLDVDQLIEGLESGADLSVQLAIQQSIPGSVSASRCAFPRAVHRGHQALADGNAVPAGREGWGFGREDRREENGLDTPGARGRGRYIDGHVNPAAEPGVAAIVAAAFHQHGDSPDAALASPAVETDATLAGGPAGTRKPPGWGRGRERCSRNLGTRFHVLPSTWCQGRSIRPPKSCIVIS